MCGCSCLIRLLFGLLGLLVAALFFGWLLENLAGWHLGSISVNALLNNLASSALNMLKTLVEALGSFFGFAGNTLNTINIGQPSPSP